MLFTVTYRGKDGALHDETVEAADRAGCVVECRKRGISPTKIVEGGKGKDRDKRGTSRVGAAGDSKRTGGWRVVVDGSRGKGRTGKRTTAGCEEAEGGETAAAQDGTASCHSHERGGGSGHERTSRPPAKGGGVERRHH